jgi:hypothetical protein
LKLFNYVLSQLKESGIVKNLLRQQVSIGLHRVHFYAINTVFLLAFRRIYKKAIGTTGVTHGQQEKC